MSTNALRLNACCLFHTDIKWQKQTSPIHYLRLLCFAGNYDSQMLHIQSAFCRRSSVRHKTVCGIIRRSIFSQIRIEWIRILHSNARRAHCNNKQRGFPKMTVMGILVSCKFRCILYFILMFLLLLWRSNTTISHGPERFSFRDVYDQRRFI